MRPPRGCPAGGKGRGWGCEGEKSGEGLPGEGGGLGCLGRGDERHRVRLLLFVVLGVTIYLRPRISVREAVRHGRAPREHHFLRAALSAHLVCAQPELPLINRPLPPRAAFDAGLAERSPGHAGNVPGREIAPGHPRCPGRPLRSAYLDAALPPGCRGLPRFSPSITLLHFN